MRVQLERILCTTDFSEASNRSVVFGQLLAQEFGATLYVCHIIDLSSVAIYGEFQVDPVGQQERIRVDAEDQLQQLLGSLPVQWESIIDVGQPSEEIGRIVEEKQIDLVISATRGRSGLKRLILGSVTERLMRSLTCPLLVIPENSQFQFKAADSGPTGNGPTGKPKPNHKNSSRAASRKSEAPMAVTIIATRRRGFSPAT